MAGEFRSADADGGQSGSAAAGAAGVAACSSEATRCGERCTDLKSDPHNCGACGEVCPDGFFCDGSGSCGERCLGSTLCGRRCVDPNNDPANCGGCGAACIDGEVCSNGTCALECSGGTLRCGNRCVDPNNDPGHCGDCKTACAIGQICLARVCSDRVPCAAHSELCNHADDNCDGRVDEAFEGAPFHLGEACTVGIGACVNKGAIDCAADGLSTECNVSPHPKQAEVCNSLDDDCDGIVDYELDGGIPVAACACDDPALSLISAEPCDAISGCTVPQCRLSAGGTELEMEYQLGACGAPFSQCIYRSASLNRVDADHGGTGILEITFCIEGSPSKARLNGLNLYFGTFPFRKKFELFSVDDLNKGVFSDCYRRYFQAQDAKCVVDNGLPLACRTGCQNGQWGVPNRPECIFDYDNVPLWLTAESCRESNVSAKVSHFTIRYLTGAACECIGSSPCRVPARPVCDLSNPNRVSSKLCKAGERCAGVCRPAR